MVVQIFVHEFFQSDNSSYLCNSIEVTLNAEFLIF